MASLKKILPLLVGLLFVLSCAEDVQKEYSTHRAYFRYNKVLTTQPLYAALTGPGMYCSIAFQNGKVTFSSLTNSVVQTLTDIAYYDKLMTINGFIVGMSNVPEMGTSTLPLLCFDRVCPNCFESGITRPVGLKEGGFAYCDRCKRTYDLNNLGLIVEGEQGLKLFRYRVSYDGNNDMLIANN